MPLQVLQVSGDGFNATQGDVAGIEKQESNMKYLSLFSGACGGDLGMQHLLGFKCLGYVEYESYCQKLIKQRIADGLLDAAPIFGDIREFISEGYAAAYTGMVDVVTGGFPCQPFSVAGKKLGEDDERNRWPGTADCIRIIRPDYAWLENVPGILNSGYFGTIVGDLHSLGFDCRWDVLSARECGALHGRPRLWIFAYSASIGRKRSFDGRNYGDHKRRILAQVSASGMPFVSQGEFREKVRATEFVRTANGLPNRMDRIRGCGNAQVPIVAATAWRILANG